MPDNLQCIIRDRDSNIAIMSKWSWKKTGCHIDHIDQQLVWARKQRNERAESYLEEFRCQVVTARWLKGEIEYRKWGLKDASVVKYDKSTLQSIVTYIVYKLHGMLDDKIQIME